MIFYDRHNFVHFFRSTPKFQSLNHPSPPVDLEVNPKSISVCITCMNRLHDLRKTLPRNLKDNSNYTNAEFVLMDYNSSDGLEDWVRSELGDYLNSGRLRYCRTECSNHFRPNHSRNLSFRLAKGELITNVDSDNLMWPGFLHRLNQCASVAERGLLIVPENFMLPGSNRLLLKGRFTLYRKDIEMLRGFDEELDEGFSYDDVNFVLRAIMSKFKIVRFEDRFVRGRIPTSDEERHENMSEERTFAEMKAVNEDITRRRLGRGIISVNPNGWGEAQVREVSASTERCFRI